MSTIYMSQLSTLPLMDQGDHRHQDQDQIGDHFASFTSLAKDPPILFPFVINNNHNPIEHHGQQIYGVHHLRQHQQQPLPLEQQPNHQFNDHMLTGGSDGFLTSPSFRPTVQSVGGDMIQRPSYDLYSYDTEKGEGRSTGKWVSSPPAKLRILRKVSDPAEGGGAAGRKPRRRAQTCEGQQQQQPMGVIRVCSDCNTTKTPLWRSGPCGPKSLCNACGIRQRKARRAMAAAAVSASTSGAAVATASRHVAQTKAPRKEKRADVDRSLPFKKRCKNMVDHATAASNSASADIVAAPKSDLFGAAFFHDFPRNEITDAAMLLMTLSCGLVRS